MAGRIKGITVEINGDTTKLSKALQSVDKNIKNTQTQLKDVEKLLKLDPTNTELLAQKQKLLGQAVQDTKTRLDTLKKASEQAAKTKDNYDAWKAKYDPLKQKISETETKLRELKEQSKTADEQLSRGEISQEKYDALQREIKGTSNDLRKCLTASHQSFSQSYMICSSLRIRRRNLCTRCSSLSTISAIQRTHTRTRISWTTSRRHSRICRRRSMP